MNVASLHLLSERPRAIRAQAKRELRRRRNVIIFSRPQGMENKNAEKRR
jgi:hypothetical protein